MRYSHEPMRMFQPRIPGVHAEASPRLNRPSRSSRSRVAGCSRAHTARLNTRGRRRSPATGDPMAVAGQPPDADAQCAGRAHDDESEPQRDARRHAARAGRRHRPEQRQGDPGEHIREPSTPAVEVPSKCRCADKCRERHGRDSMLARRTVRRPAERGSTAVHRRADTVHRLDRVILFRRRGPVPRLESVDRRVLRGCVITKAFLSALLVLALAASAHAEKITKETVTSQGVERTYYPSSRIAPKNKPAPLSILLHGSGRDGKILVEHWQSLAKKEGIILAGPDAIVRDGWGRDDGPLFIRHVVEAVQTDYAVDRRAMYVFGHSAGAIFGISMGVLESETLPRWPCMPARCRRRSSRPSPELRARFR